VEENMNDIVFSILLAVVGLFVGATIVVLYNKYKVSGAQKEADKLIANAKKEAEKAKRDGILELKEESFKLKKQTDENILLKEKLKKKNKKSARFYKKIPSFIRSFSQYEPDLSSRGLKQISENKYNEKKENQRYAVDLRNDQIYESKKNSDNSIKSKIALFNSKIDFKLSIDELKNQKFSSKSLLIKNIISSINLDQKDIFLDKILSSKLNSIADDNSLTNELKTKMLEEIFKEFGYYIPLNFYLGGMIIIESEASESNEKRGNNINANINSNINEVVTIDGKSSYSKKDIGKISLSSLKGSIIGGNAKEKTIEGWEVSINENNSAIIAVGNIIDITELFDPILTKKLNEPINMIKKKINNRREYYKIYEDIKKIKFKSDYTHNDQEGRFHKDENGLIEMKKETIEVGSSNFIYSGPVDVEFGNIIIGWRVKNAGGYECEYSFKENPLLNQKIEIEFKGNFWSSKKIIIEIFYMKFPE
jgi:hypothetical protein